MLHSESKKMEIELAKHGCPFSSGIQTESRKGNSVVRLKNFITGTEAVDTLHKKASVPTECCPMRCVGSLMDPTQGKFVRPTGIPRPKLEVKQHAEDFLSQFYSAKKLKDSSAHCNRLNDVLSTIEETGSYELTKDELIFGAKTAWRNAPRCIGRIQWNNLQLFDARHVQTAREMFEIIVEYLKFATNKGNIKSGIVVFPQRRKPMKDFRVWNTQLIRYAGYKQADGSIIGDPANVEFTEVCKELGWQGNEGRFDVLPLVLQANGQHPELFELPPEVVLEVNIKHPRIAAIEEMGLKWFAVPAVSFMKLDCGGVEFPGCPFNGWYLETEIVRDFVDIQRYNLIKPIAAKMGLDTSSNGTLWKDRVLLELSAAVLYSFQEAGVTLVDHHTVSDQFVYHMANEVATRGGTPADWVWIVPPVSGGLTSVFHQEMLNYVLKPSYDYQREPWRVTPLACEKSGSASRKKLSFRALLISVRFTASFMYQITRKRNRVTILYATETGTSQKFAKTLGKLFSQAFNARVLCMENYSGEELQNEQLVLVVTSTFGNGDAPTNGKDFASYLHQMCSRAREPKVPLSKEKPKRGSKKIQETKPDSLSLSKMRYSVFGLGNSSYKEFCAFARTVDKQLKDLGGNQILPMGEADELSGQEEAFKSWAPRIFEASCQAFSMTNVANTSAVQSLATTSHQWNSDNYRLVKTDGNKMNLCEALSKTYGKEVRSSKVISVRNLQSRNSSRETLLVRLATGDQQSLNYKPGDHVAVFPANRPELVDALIDVIYDKPEPEQLIDIEARQENEGGTTSWKPYSHIHATCTLREAFSRFLDITSTPKPQMLLNIATQTTEPAEREALELLGKDTKKYNEWRTGKPNILDVIEEYPFLRVSALFLLTQLPLLQPRLYSVSSSPDMYPDELHLTVSVVQFNKKGVQSSGVHHGVCSTWLKELKPGDVVPCYVREAQSFHMPEDHTVPIVLVGAGSGIAPLRGFWQQRQHDRDCIPIDSLQVSDVTFASKEKTNRLKRTNSWLKKHFRCGCFCNDPVTGILEETCYENHNDMFPWGEMYLFFGCRSPKCDDIYEKEIVEATKEGALTEVFKAFSRAPEEPKCYVQDKLKEQAFKVCELLSSQDGHIFVCGGNEMAEDVSATLTEMFQESFNMDTAEAQNLINELKVTGRYHEDVFGKKTW